MGATELNHRRVMLSSDSRLAGPAAFGPLFFSRCAAQSNLFDLLILENDDSQAEEDRLSVSSPHSLIYHRQLRVAAQLPIRVFAKVMRLGEVTQVA